MLKHMLVRDWNAHMVANVAREKKRAEKREYRLSTEFIWSSFNVLKTFLGEGSFFRYWAEPVPYFFR